MSVSFDKQLELNHYYYYVVWLFNRSLFTIWFNGVSMEEDSCHLRGFRLRSI